MGGKAFMPGVYAGISTTPRSPVPNFGASLIQETLTGITAVFLLSIKNFSLQHFHSVDNQQDTMGTTEVQPKVVLEGP